LVVQPPPLNPESLDDFNEVLLHRSASSPWMVMHFEIISDITQIEPIAVGSAIRDLARLCRAYGACRWRKLEGIATICLAMAGIRVAE
jgi:hypothetical protein